MMERLRAVSVAEVDAAVRMLGEPLKVVLAVERACCTGDGWTCV
jgi:hypothetical protein